MIAEHLPKELFEPATEIAPGVTLTTLDGAQIGNAIVIQKQPRNYRGELIDDTDASKRLWLIETDFGNRLICTENEIHELFGLGFQQEYNDWWDARLALIKKTVEG